MQARHDGVIAAHIAERRIERSDLCLAADRRRIADRRGARGPRPTRLTSEPGDHVAALRPLCGIA